MLDPIEQRLYENTQRLLDSNSTEFLTPDEQMFIGQQLNRAILRELENNSSLDAAAVSSLSNLCDWLKNEDLFDLNGLDSSWLRELKGADFSIFFNEKKGDNARTGGITVQDAENGLAVLMNAKDGKSYREMRMALLHELRHVWQHL